MADMTRPRLARLAAFLLPPVSLVVGLVPPAAAVVEETTTTTGQTLALDVDSTLILGTAVANGGATISPGPATIETVTVRFDEDPPADVDLESGRFEATKKLPGATSVVVVTTVTASDGTTLSTQDKVFAPGAREGIGASISPVSCVDGKGQVTFHLRAADDAPTVFVRFDNGEPASMHQHPVPAGTLEKVVVGGLENGFHDFEIMFDPGENFSTVQALLREGRTVACTATKTQVLPNTGPDLRLGGLAASGLLLVCLGGVLISLGRNGTTRNKTHAAAVVAEGRMLR